MVKQGITTLKPFYTLSISLWLVMISVFAQMAISAPSVSLSRQHIASNESVELTVSLDKDEDIPSTFINQLKQHFSIENLGRSSETSCVNFKCSSSYKTTLLLSPKGVGLLTIPALSISTGASKPLQIKVSEPNNDPDAGDLQDVFIELSLDKKEAYIDEQILLTLKINSAIQLTNVQLSPIEVDNLNVKELNKDTYQRNLGGVPYTTYEITYALFAKASGQLSIPPVRATGLIPDGRTAGFGSFFNSGKRINIRSNSVSFKVLPIPQQAQDEWLPAQSVIIKDKWLSDLNQAKVGESITGEITLSALGLSSEQLPSLHIKESPNYKLYLEKPELDNHQNENGIIGIRKEKFAIVPNKAGTIVFPTIEIQWWDIATQSFKTAELPAKNINIKPNAEIPPVEPTLQPLSAIPEETPPAASTIDNNPVVTPSPYQPLFYLSAFINAGLLLLCLWLFTRKKTPVSQKPTANNQSSSHWQDTLSSACKKQNPKAIKQALIAAIKASTGKKDIASLSDIQRLYPDTETRHILQQLEKADYEQQSILLDSNQLINIFSLGTKDKKNKLADLYPTH
ncbi:MAG: BatD family protein [Cellvibrionales bacterium]|nr:BatD family protein [Cellvibrionales bacterium]